MENKGKNKNNKKRLSYIVSILAIFCIFLLVAEIGINTQAEIKANRLNEGYAVNAEFDANGDINIPTETPVPTWDPSIPTPTLNPNVN